MQAALDMAMPAPVATTQAPRAQPRGATCQLEMTGQLVRRPYVANKPLDREGHMAPVLVLELADVGAGHHNVVAHIPFHEAGRAEAEAQARRLQRGQRVTVVTELVDIRVLLPAARISDVQP